MSTMMPRAPEHNPPNTRRYTSCSVCGTPCHSAYALCVQHRHRTPGPGSPGRVDLDDLRYLIDCRTDLEEIARRCGLRPGSVVRRLQRNGIPVPAGWSYRARVAAA